MSSNLPYSGAMLQMQPTLAEEEGLAWRNQLTLRLVRSFFFVFLVSAPLTWFTLHGQRGRYSLTALTLCLAVVVAIPSITRRPEGTLRSWMVIVPALAASMWGFATLGFLSGPGVSLTITLMLSGLLLGARVMVTLIVLSALSVAAIGWAVLSGHFPSPPPLDLAVTKPLPWIRSVGVTFFGITLFGSMMVAVITRMEATLQRVRSETLRREKAERERSEAQLAALETKQLETIGRLAAGVAHDFNNNLTSIMGCAELLKFELSEQPSSRELVDGILKSSQHAAELTRQLLVYSRKAQMLQAPTDVHPIIQDAVSFLRRSIDPKVSVVTELQARTSIVHADPTLLRSALLNLLVNAIDAMPDGGTVSITTLTVDVGSRAQALGPGPYLLIEVMDTGLGIARDLLPHIFDPFFTTKTIGKGTGLGLAAVAGTIKAHAGRIDVDSEPGRGTVFRIHLPCLNQERHQTQPEAGEVIHGTGEVLLVDDDAMVSLAATASLESLGYQVTRAADGATAVDLVRANRQRFRLVLLDLRMPGMSGEATFNALSSLAPQLPILIWSGYGAEQDVHGMIRRGARGFIQKPYRLAELSRTVAQAMNSLAQGPREPPHAARGLPELRSD